jgi:hypothetical protein
MSRPAPNPPPPTGTEREAAGHARDLAAAERRIPAPAIPPGTLITRQQWRKTRPELEKLIFAFLAGRPANKLPANCAQELVSIFDDILGYNPRMDTFEEP